MPKPPPKTQDAYLHDMWESACLIDRYTRKVTFEQFRSNSEKRDAVALRLSVLGESAHKIDRATEAALPQVPFAALRGLRNRIAHDYGSVDFRIVWTISQEEIKPLIAALASRLQRLTPPKRGKARP